MIVWFRWARVHWKLQKSSSWFSTVQHTKWPHLRVRQWRMSYCPAITPLHPYLYISHWLHYQTKRVWWFSCKNMRDLFFFKYVYTLWLLLEMPKIVILKKWLIEIIIFKAIDACMFLIRKSTLLIRFNLYAFFFVDAI